MYLVNVDWYVNGDVYQVSQGQAGYQSIGSIPHAFILADNPEQGGVSNDPDSKYNTGHHGVDVLEGRFYRCVLQAARRGYRAHMNHQGGVGGGRGGRRLSFVFVFQLVGVF